MVQSELSKDSSLNELDRRLASRAILCTLPNCGKWHGTEQSWVNHCKAVHLCFRKSSKKVVLKVCPDLDCIAGYIEYSAFPHVHARQCVVDQD